MWIQKHLHAAFCTMALDEHATLKKKGPFCAALNVDGMIMYLTPFSICKKNHPLTHTFILFSYEEWEREVLNENSFFFVYKHGFERLLAMVKK